MPRQPTQTWLRFATRKLRRGSLRLVAVGAASIATVPLRVR